MKVLPPEIIDGILYLLSAALGWFGRWLQDRNKKKEYNEILSEQNTIINDQQTTMKGLKNQIDNLRKREI